MLQMIHKIRDKYTYWLLLLFVPLEVLPFLCEPDSTMGKALLLIKAALFGILYFLYADKQKWYTHVLLLITCVSMGISVLRHGGAGTALLILTMFFALIAFPKIEIENNRLRWLYLFLAIGSTSIAIYGMVLNYVNGVSAFSWRGDFNPNTFGMILLSVLFYFLSCMHLNDEKINWLDCVLLIVIIFLIFKSNCRSALLCVIALVVMYVIFYKTKFGRAAYYVVAALSMLICFTIAIFELKVNISESANRLELLGKKIFSGRERIWGAALEGFINSPFWGQPSEYLIEYTNLASAHNVFMGIIVSLGLLPGMLYIMLIYAPKTLLGNIDDLKPKHINKICFITTILLSTFECIYTDSRINMLFLPLLFTNLSTCNNKDVGIDELLMEEATENRTKRTFQLPTNKNKEVVVFFISILITFVFLEPLALNITYNNLPCKVCKDYLNEVGYKDNKLNVINGDNCYSEDCYGIIWHWNGSSFDVIGKANAFTFRDFYHDINLLPEWAIPGKQYHIIYESGSVKFRIYYSSVDGQWYSLVYTNTSVDFTIPKEAKGLIVRIELSEGDSAFEKVMPIIYALEDEPIMMKEKRIELPTLMNSQFYEKMGYDNKACPNVIGNNAYPSVESKGVIWEWNGERFNVKGKAIQFSFFDFYNSQNLLPEWAIPGKEFQVFYEAEIVRFRIYYYTPNGVWNELVSTTTSTDFVIPYDAQGLIVRLEVTEGNNAFESVMPIIFAKGSKS